MSLQRRSSHTGGCLFILFTVVIVMVCSAPAFENDEKLVVNSPVGRHIIHSMRLSHPAESLDLNSETSQYQLPKHLDDSSQEDKVNTRKKKYTVNRLPGRRLRKLVKRSEEKEEGKSDEKEYEKSKEVDENGVDKDVDDGEEKSGEKVQEKREEKGEHKEDDDDEWDAKSGPQPAESDSNEHEGEKNGLSPVKGPYLNVSGSDDKQKGSAQPAIQPADESSASSGPGAHEHTHTFRNWEEYLQAQKEGRGRESFRKPAYRPVIHSDDHFRYIDKLFKAKNDKVKAFHALVLYMKQQGKSFKIPQRPTRQTTTTPGTGSSNELGMGSTAKTSN